MTQNYKSTDLSMFKPAQQESIRRQLAGKPAPKLKTVEKPNPPGPREMNATERALADRLKMMKLAGEIRWYDYERFTVNLAYRTTWTADFAVETMTGALVLYEVKGSYLFDEALVKPKVAAVAQPFKIMLARLINGQWIIKELPKNPMGNVT